MRRRGGPLGVVASVALALVALAPASLFAEPPETSEPVASPRSDDGGREGPALDMRADELEIDLENRRAELRGNVELWRGDFKVKCAKVEIEYDEDLEVARAKGTGGVVAEGKGIRGEAPEVVVDLAARTASLQGGVRVKQKNAVVLAERATVHLDSGRVVLYKVKGTLGGSGAGGAKGRAAPPPPVSALEVRGLRVTLGRREVLGGIDLTVDEGEIVGVFGPSGAGKSTLFAALAGEIAPEGGTVLLFGREASGPLWVRARRGLGYLPQPPSVLWDLTAEENVRVFASTRSSPPAEDWLERLGLGDRRGTRASSLSGGERRRLELARVLIGEPRLLLCDEPFAALDPEGSERVGSELRALAQRGGAVVVADHRIGLALACCDRAYLLVEGHVDAEAKASAFLRDPRVRAVYAEPQSR